MLRLTIAVLSAALIAFQAVPVHAQAVCGDRAKMISHLGANYSEQPVAMGLTSTGAVIEVLTSPSGTWTFLVTEPSGLTCMVASGESWESLPIIPAGKVS